MSKLPAQSICRIEKARVRITDSVSGVDIDIHPCRAGALIRFSWLRLSSVGEIDLG